MRRSFGRGFRRGPRKKAIWVNIPFTVTFAEAAGFLLLVLPEYWEAQFGGEANETAVLRAVRGAVTWQQAGAGATGNNAFWGLYIADKDSTVSPTYSIAGMGDYDWLHVDTFGIQATASSANAPLQSKEVQVKAKRRLKSRDAIYIVGQIAPDANSPSATISGILRFLIARD